MSGFSFSTIGLAGVPKARFFICKTLEKKLQLPMIFLSICSLPTIYLEFIATEQYLNSIGWWINFIILSCFVAEIVWMLSLSHYKIDYLKANWLNVLIIIFTAISLTGLDGEWIALIRLLRLGSITLLLARVFDSVRKLYTPDSIPHMILLAFTTMTLGGAGFYWIEPTVHSYSEGLWLAFITGATVGYGDFLPTTNASRIFAVIIVLMGYSVISLITANISASFVGNEDKKFRKKLQNELNMLRAEVQELNQQLKNQSEQNDRLRRIEYYLLHKNKKETN